MLLFFCNYYLTVGTTFLEDGNNVAMGLIIFVGSLGLCVTLFLLLSVCLYLFFDFCGVL